MKYRGLIAMDLDYTLLMPQFYITPGNLAALKKAHEAGYLLALCTGRSAYMVLRRYDDWKVKGLIDIIIGCNGSEYLDLHSSLDVSVIGFVTKAAVKEVLELTKGIPVGFAWYGKDVVYTNPDNPHADIIAQQMGIPLEVIPQEELAERFPNVWAKAVFFLADESQQYIKELIEKDQKEDYRLVFSDPLILEILPSDIDKGVGIKKAAKTYDIDLKNAMGIGDNYNDWEMLDVCGFGVAMGNGVDYLKERADYVTGSIYQDGVAQAIGIFLKQQQEETKHDQEI